MTEDFSPSLSNDIGNDSQAPAMGVVSFDVRRLRVMFRNNVIGLHDISFAESCGCLIGIMGASGSGKTTLLNTLCGLEKPSSGEVLVNGINLHRNKDRLQGLIGYIPQDDLLIEELTVFENLFFNAQLCFRNKSFGELEEIVNKTLLSLGLYERRHLKVGSFMNKTISGGQRKRLNIALELIREPSILFVDEPTSGLSSNDSENVMELMRDLALRGKQVYVVIHQPSSDIFKMFDRILILDAGHQIYYGNPIDAVMYFKRIAEKVNCDVGECPICGNVNPEAIFNIIEEKEETPESKLNPLAAKRKRSPEQWETIYHKEYKQQSIVETLSGALTSILNIPNWFKQWRIYLMRDLKSKISNRQYMLLTLLEAPVLGLILSYVVRYIADPLSDTYIFRENENIPIFIFMSLIVALFLGLIVSAEEIFRDRKILRRESFIHLSRSAYLAAKICILLCISAVQCFLFVVVANSVLGVREMYFAYWLALFATAAASNLLGLVISESFNSAVTIYIVIPLLMIPMMVLSGAMFSFDKLNRRVSNVDKVPLVAEFMITRWSYEALMVHQYKDNRYERYFYDIEKRESMTDFKQVYVFPELQIRLAHCNAELEKSGAIVNNIHALNLLRNEVARELKVNSNAQFDLSLLTPETFDSNSSACLQEFINGMQMFYQQQFTLANQEKERLINYMLEQDKQKFETLKNNYFNDHLAEIVKNFFEKNKMLEYGDRLIQEIDPIYEDPVPSGFFNFRTHFFAPRKHFAGRFIDTYNFNLCMIGVIFVLLYLILYYNILQRIIIFFQRKMFGKVKTYT